MEAPSEQFVTSCDGETKRGGALVVAAVALALYNFVGGYAIGILLFAFIAWKLLSGSRAAYWVMSLAALGFGSVQLYDIAVGAHGEQFLSDHILIWTRCLCGFAAPSLLWLRKDVRHYLYDTRKSGAGTSKSTQQEG